MNVITTRVRRRFSPSRLKSARERRGLTQREMSEAIVRDIRQYQRIEAGHMRPTPDQLAELADALEVTIDSLYAIPDEEGSTRSDG